MVQSGKDLTLKTAAGKESAKLTIADGAFPYRSSIMFESGSEMKPGSEVMTVKEFASGGLLQIAREGERMLYNDRDTAGWPKYTVTKRGDMYVIEYSSTTSSLVFKVYFTNGSIFLVRNGFVILTVRTTESSILVNARERVTYLRG